MRANLALSPAASPAYNRDMKIEALPRRRYTPNPTPIQMLGKLSSHPARPEIWIKRDDLTALASGGVPQS